MAKVLLGVSGGIAAYKAAAIVRELVKRGDEVRVVMTRGAQEFITPLTLQVVSQNAVATDLFDTTQEHEIGHIELARWPDVILLAPATAQLIAQLAGGMASDLLTTILLATRAPVVVAPAMNTQMYLHPAVQRNLQTLRDDGHHLVEPDAGVLACQEVGPGRLPDPPVLLAAIDRAIGPNLLQGRRVLISAGPTREALDPARFISNPSTGKMGYALARAAHTLGAEVTLVSGPVALDTPPGARRLDVITAQQMADTVWAEAPSHDLVIMCAAVADWRPKDPSATKRAKSEMTGTLELTRNPDILARLGEQFGPHTDGPGPTIVGFAAESHDVEARATAKLARKQAHLIIANLIGGPSSAFGSDRSSATIIHHAQGALARLGPDTKEALALEIMRALTSV